MTPNPLKGAAFLLPLLLLAGCATPGPEKTAANATQSGPSPNIPTHLSGTGPSLQAAEATPPTECSEKDLAVGEKIREMLLEDKTLAPPPSNIITVVSRGVVTMKGYIRSRRAASELHQRIANLPGVLYVQDELLLWNGRKI